MFRKVIDFINRNQPIYFAVILCSLAITWLLNSLQKDSYEATAEIFVTEAKNQSSIISDDLNYKTENSSAIRPADEIALMLGTPLLKNAALKLEALPLKSKDQQAFIARSAEKYKKQLKIEPIAGKPGNIIVKAYASNEKKAVLLASAVIDSYIEQVSIASENGAGNYPPEVINKLSEYIAKLNQMDESSSFFVTNQEKYSLDNLSKEKILEIETERIKVGKEENKTISYLESMALPDNIKRLNNDRLPENLEISFAKKELLALEFKAYYNKLLYPRSSAVLQTDEEEITQQKNSLVELVKAGRTDITPEEETGLSLAIRQLYLSDRLKILDAIYGRTYVDIDSPGSNYFEYVQLRENILTLINKLKIPPPAAGKDGKEKKSPPARNYIVKIVTPAFSNPEPIKEKKKISYFFSLVLWISLGTLIARVKKTAVKM